MLLAVDMSKFRKEEQSNGPAPYFRAELTKFIQNLIREKDLKSDGTPYNIYTDGFENLHHHRSQVSGVCRTSLQRTHGMVAKRYFRQWKGMDPWSYEADEFQKKLRKEVLISQAKASPRYLNLRKKIV